MRSVNEIRWQQRDGRLARTCYIQAGQGEPLILIHGVGMNRLFWSPQIDDLAKDYRVIALDMLGHGDSTNPSEDAGLPDYCDQILTLLDDLGLDRVHLAGHSMGALVALEFALTHPDRLYDVAALNAVYCRSPHQREIVQKRADTLLLGDGLNDSVEESLTRWFDSPFSPQLKEVVRYVRHTLSNVDRVGYARTYRLFASSDDRHKGLLEGLKVPGLFMTADGDRNSTPEMSRAMAASAPSGTCEIIPGERHMMTLTAPSVINQKLRSFFHRDNSFQRSRLSAT